MSREIRNALLASDDYEKNETGEWLIFGADINPDFHGFHYQAFLGTFNGTYRDAVDHALNTDGFIGWGSGRIRKRKDGEPLDFDSYQKAYLKYEIRYLEREIRSLEISRAKLESELGYKVKELGRM